MGAFDKEIFVREIMGIMRKCAGDAMEKITRSCYDLGRVSALIESGQLSRYITYNEATRPRNKGGYGRGTVDRWIDEGLLEKIKDGKGNCKVRLDRLRLAELDAKANRASWFACHETKESGNREKAAGFSPSSAKA